MSLYTFEQLSTVLRKFNRAFSIPIALYQNNEPVLTFSRQYLPVNPAWYFIKPYINSEPPVGFLVAPDSLLIGYIALSDKDQYVIVGPSCSYDLTPEELREVLNTLHLSSRDFYALARFFRFIPKTNNSEFREILNFISCALSPDQTSEAEQLTYKAESSSPGTEKIDLSMLPSVTPETENHLRDLIVHGRVDELKEYLININSASGTTAPILALDAIRSLKNTIISSIAITARYAVSGGMDFNSAILLSDYYINYIEQLTQYEDIMQLFNDMLIDYANRISLCSLPDTDSATVNHIYRDVQVHLHEKISSSDIAHHLNLSQSYLCHHFKEKTGKTLAVYILEQKIKESQYLLNATDLPLSEIADRLAFSSQQKFQSQFKKMTGETPAHYRKKTIDEF